MPIRAEPCRAGGAVPCRAVPCQADTLRGADVQNPSRHSEARTNAHMAWTLSQSWLIALQACQVMRTEAEVWLYYYGMFVRKTDTVFATVASGQTFFDQVYFFGHADAHVRTMLKMLELQSEEQK